MLKPSNLTPAQKGNLVRFVRQARAQAGEPWIRDKDFGSIAGLNHLIRKGALRIVHEEIGPRGGRTRILAPTPEGYQVADKINFNGHKTWR